MLLLYHLLCFGKSNDNMSEISFTDIHTFKMQLEENQERSILIDQNYITSVFDLVDNIQIEAFVVKGNYSYSIGKMDKNNKKFALHSGNSEICFKITSFVKTEYTFHMIRDNKNCERSFISTKSNEKFSISEKNTANVTTAGNQKICFLHAPKGSYKYQNTVFDSAQNFKLLIYKGDKSPRSIISDSTDSGDATGESFFVWRTYESENYPVWSYSTRGVDDGNSYSINYIKSDDLFFITPTGLDEPKIDYARQFTIEPASKTHSNNPSQTIYQLSSTSPTPPIISPTFNQILGTPEPSPTIEKIDLVPQNLHVNDVEHKNQNRITIDISTTTLLVALIIVLFFIIIILVYYVFCMQRRSEKADEIGLLSQPYRDDFGYQYPSPYYPVYEYQDTPRAFAPGE